MVAAERDMPGSKVGIWFGIGLCQDRQGWARDPGGGFGGPGLYHVSFQAPLAPAMAVVR